MSRQPVPLETSEPIVPPALTSANGHVLRTPVPLPALAPDPTTCATCGAQADEPPRNPTPRRTVPVTLTLRDSSGRIGSPGLLTVPFVPVR